VKTSTARWTLTLCVVLFLLAGPNLPAQMTATAAPLAATDPVATAALPVLTRFPVTSGNPLFVAAASPQEVWFTLPEQNQVGRLIVGDNTTPGVMYFLPIPTASAGAYAIAYGGGYAWFSESAVGKIGMINAATDEMSEIQLAPGSEPQRLAVLVPASGPTHVWIADRGNNQLVDLAVTTPTDYTAITHPMPAEQAGAQLEGIALQTDRATHKTLEAVWFSAPGQHRIGRWTSGAGFGPLPAVGGEPGALAVDADNTIWFTEPQTDRIGHYLATTLAITIWWPLPANSGPFDFTTGAGRVFFTERIAGRLGWGALNSMTAPHQFGLDEGDPAGIALDANGCAWVAQSSPSTLARWCPPYALTVNLPLIVRQ
jgi:streptogramin lyase